MSNSPCCTLKSWYAVKVRNLNELAVSQILKDKFEMETIVPTQRVWMRKDGRRIAVTKPLFSTYVFVKTNLELLNNSFFYSVNSIFGIVSNGGRPAPIPDIEIQSLNKLGKSEMPVYEVDYKKFKDNDRVVVVEGPLRGAVGNIVTTDAIRGKFTVSLEFFKRALVTELDLDMVRSF